MVRKLRFDARPGGNGGKSLRPAGDEGIVTLPAPRALGIMSEVASTATPAVDQKATMRLLPISYSCLSIESSRQSLANVALVDR